MNREMMRASIKLGKRMMKHPPGEFEEIPYSEIISRFDGRVNKLPDRAWKNNHFVVQLYRRDRLVLGVLHDKIMIRKNDGQPIREWYCLQEIKNKIAGDEVSAIQIFPKESELVDEANMYWLFVEAGNL